MMLSRKIIGTETDEKGRNNRIQTIKNQMNKTKK